jgi:hypothetical protein
MSRSASYAARWSNTLTTVVLMPHLLKANLPRFVPLVIALPLVFVLASWQSLGAESTPPPSATNQIEQTNSLEVLRAMLQLQEQLRATQVAVEQSRHETKEAITQTADVLSKAFQSIEEAFAAQRVQNLEEIQHSNRLTLTLAATFAAMGLLIILLMTHFQRRMTKALNGISTALPTAFLLDPRPAEHPISLALESNPQLLLAIQQVEQRVRLLEHTSEPGLELANGKSMDFQAQPYHPRHGSSRRRRAKAFGTAVFVAFLVSGVTSLVIYMVYVQVKP